MTAYFEAGTVVGATSEDFRWVFEDLIEQDAAGTLPVRVMTFPAENIQSQFEAVQAAGLDMHIHIDGDGSTRVVLDAYEAALRRPGAEGRRHVLAHNSMADPADIGRYAAMGIIANCTPLTYASDFPGVDIPEIPPLIRIEALVTRTRPGYADGPPLVARQRIGLHDALRGYTANGAYQLRLEHRTGTLTAGKAADLTVLGADLFRVDPRERHAVPVVLTMMDGRITHDAR